MLRTLLSDTVMPIAANRRTMPDLERASANAGWDPSPWQVSLGDLLASLRRRYLADGTTVDFKAAHSGALRTAISMCAIHGPAAVESVPRGA